MTVATRPPTSLQHFKFLAIDISVETDVTRLPPRRNTTQRQKRSAMASFDDEARKAIPSEVHMISGRYVRETVVSILEYCC